MKQGLNIWFLSLIMAVGISVKGQAQGIEKGLIRSQGTFALGLRSDDINYYLHGELGYLFTQNIELNGVIFGNIGSSNVNSLDYRNGPPDPSATTQTDTRNHTIFFGPKYHFFPEQAFDAFVGIQPGLSLIHIPPNGASGLPTNGLAPQYSALAGIALYGSFFHLFAETRWVGGQFLNETYSVPLNEFRVSFGLGFNLNTQ